MADATTPPEQQGVVDESLKQRLKKQPRRQELSEIEPCPSDLSSGEDHELELRGQKLRGNQ